MRNQRALAESRAFSVRRIPLLRPLGWLARGWSDLWRCPLPGLLHGPREPERLPSQSIDPNQGDLFWYIDRAAASRLDD